MTYDFAAYYRKSAEACHKRAKASKTQIEKDRWLTLAQEHLQLAKQAHLAKKE
jgi:hypothetical protein